MALLDPITRRRFKRFCSIKRGYYSFLLLLGFIVFSCFAEIFVNSRAVVVVYKGDWYFPTYGAMKPGTAFGLDYGYETNYRELKAKFEMNKDTSEGWVLLPLIPYNPLENDLVEGIYPPSAPDFSRSHYLGTDNSGRDVAARLIYGFRICIFFALFYVLCNYTVGVSLGALMGYSGGRFDLIMQRLIEIWSNIPFLYVVMIVSSILAPNFFTLAIIMVVFGWMHMTWYMRTAVYKEKTRDYSVAARALGAKPQRVIFHHILPNAVSTIVAFVPFSIAGAIYSLTSLDYLGYGLSPPTPSWGELLAQGTGQLDKPWIVMSVVCALVLVLTLVTFFGEAIREAFDPRKHTVYE